MTRSGLFVRLTRYRCADGFIPDRRSLGDEYFTYQDEPAHAVVGTRTRTTYRLGDVAGG